MTDSTKRHGAPTRWTAFSDAYPVTRYVERLRDYPFTTVRTETP